MRYEQITRVVDLPEAIPEELPLSKRQFERRLLKARKRIMSGITVREAQTITDAQEAVAEVMLPALLMYLRDVLDTDIVWLRSLWNRFEITSHGSWDKGEFRIVQWQEDERAPSRRVSETVVSKTKLIRYIERVLR